MLSTHTYIYIYVDIIGDKNIPFFYLFRFVLFDTQLTLFDFRRGNKDYIVKINWQKNINLSFYIYI